MRTEENRGKRILNRTPMTSKQIRSNHTAAGIIDSPTPPRSKLFDNSIVRGPQETVDFITNILESSTEYSSIAKGLDGQILLWNEGARRLYGYSPEEVIGKANSAIQSEWPRGASAHPGGYPHPAHSRGCFDLFKRGGGCH
jgi:PAS domain-containing protein